MKRLLSRSVAKFLVPDWGDIVDSGIGLSHRYTGPPGRNDNSVPELTLSLLSQRLRIWLQFFKMFSIQSRGILQIEELGGTVGPGDTSQRRAWGDASNKCCLEAGEDTDSPITGEKSPPPTSKKENCISRERGLLGEGGGALKGTGSQDIIKIIGQKRCFSVWIGTSTGF